MECDVLCDFQVWVCMYVRTYSLRMLECSRDLGVQETFV